MVLYTAKGAVTVFAALTCSAFAVQPAVADVVSVGANGFEVRESVIVKASAAKAYRTLLTPSLWWSSEHTFSGSAANLRLDARVGGCWCEKLADGGSVEHLRVVYLSPGKILRMRGALGPFQGLAVDGAMTMTVKSGAEGTEISFVYALGGYAKDGFDGLSKGADQVLSEQIGRLKKLLDAPSAAR